MGGSSREARLLERIRREEPGAFEEFVDGWGERIFGFSLRMCGEREDARDVVQETLLKAYRSLATLEHPRALKAWVFRVAANACLMKRRKGKHEPARELSLEELLPDEPGRAGLQIPDPASLPDEDAARHELAGVVREAVSRLPPLYRVVVVLRDLEQLTTRETAEALDVTEETVRTRLSRGRLMVRRALEEKASGGAPHDA